MCFNPAWDFGCFHPFNGCRCASLHVLNPLFLFNFSWVNLFIDIFHAGDVTVLVAICVWNCYPLLFHNLSFCGLLCLLFQLLHHSLFCWSEFSFVFFLFVWTMRRSTFRWVDGIFLSCSFDSVQVPEASLSVSVITMLKKRSLCCRKYDFDVNSFLYLLNEAQAALIRFLISTVSCCWNVMVCPRYFALSHADNISTYMLLISISFLLFGLWLLRIFVLSQWIFNPTLSVLCLKSHIIFWSCTCDVENRSTSSAKRRFVRQSDSQSPSTCPCLLSFASVSHRLFSAIWSAVLKRKLDNGSPCSVPSLSRICRFPCLSRPSLSDPRKASSRGWCIVIRYRIFRLLSTMTGGLLSQMPSWSPLSRPTFSPDISVHVARWSSVWYESRNPLASSTSLTICLIISFVVSSHVLMSSARITLLSLAFSFKLSMWSEHLVTLHVQTQTLCHHNTLHWFVTRSRVAQLVPSIK